MFNYDTGLGPGKWLNWFMACAAIYALLTLFPENRVAAVIGGFFAFPAISIARRQIANRENRNSVAGVAAVMGPWLP
jgi:hypothetical protein